jgi:hypothetical protein
LGSSGILGIENRKPKTENCKLFLSFEAGNNYEKKKFNFFYLILFLFIYLFFRVRADAAECPGGRERGGEGDASTRTPMSARMRLVLSQVTSKRTLLCVQVTDALAAIVRSSVRPSENVRVTTMDEHEQIKDHQFWEEVQG